VNARNTDPPIYYSTCRTIVEQNKGVIDVHSDEAETCFIIRLPLDNPLSADAPPKAA